MENIDNYCIECLIEYFSSLIIRKRNKNKNDNLIDTNNFSKNIKIIDEYLLEKYLKFDLCENLYINKIKSIWTTHLLSIFTSPTIKSVFNEFCKTINKDFIPYDFLNDDDLKSIFQNCRYFLFPTDRLGYTEPFYLFDYEYYGGFIEKYGENCSKLINLSINQITKEHEILGEINFMIQKYLSKKELFFSIKNSSNNYYENFEENTPGEYIEKLLYGETLVNLTYNEILFILDLENYNVNYEKFKDNFNKCNEKLYIPSQYLNNLLKSLNINMNKEYNSFGYISINENLINKREPKDMSQFYGTRHSHLHPKKMFDETDKIIDEIYKDVLKKKNNQDN